MNNYAEEIQNGQAVLGIELGSTRIKAVLVGTDNQPIASGGYSWENQLIDGVWTYSLDEVWAGVQASYSALKKNVLAEHGVELSTIKAIGFSAMMHGYLVFGADNEQLVPFRTWRNNITGPASEKLGELFDYPIPQRWSIAHLYQAILNGESHVGEITYMTTLAGYVHWKLTGQKAMGIGEASGMFPIDIGSQDFNAGMIAQFDELVQEKGYGWSLKELLPQVLSAGESAGALTEEGAKLLDPSGSLKPGIPFCPPEGDAGTGMVATNSVEVRTGNVSAGTSVFAMLVLEKELTKAHHEIDLVTTPDGKLVGMAHTNNCSSDIDAWIGLLGDAAKTMGADFSTDELYARLFNLALTGDADCGGLLAYGYVSGEHVTGFTEGRPLFVRSPDNRLTLPNFIRTHLFTALCALRTGLNVLFVDEGVEVDEIRGHGGFFKTPVVGQRIMAAATGAPVSTLDTAGEGGAWGIALLAAYMMRADQAMTLPEFLKPVFADSMGAAVEPDPEDVAGFLRFFERYHRGLSIERAAVDAI
ncbi:xylulokinase [Cerasicoccus fimbriatus]|uniref:xylulokinase n=1 Tax=Cerasicoccus fimbriatus TaxID=3014554 RepID=UPI0022B4101F|nr:FGGY-family carbohydrate kinase [Cerasicoccus sp. TK19100]